MGKINIKIMIGKHMHYVNIDAVLAISRLSWQHSVHSLLNSLNMTILQCSDFFMKSMNVLIYLFFSTSVNVKTIL